MVVDINRHEINKIITALKNDDYIRSNIVILEKEEDDKNEENRTENIFYIKMSSIILNNINLIQEYSIDELISPNKYEGIPIEQINSFRNNLYNLFEESSLLSSFNNTLLRKIIFSIKYFSIKEFFLKNYFRFLPSYDVMYIQKSDKSRLFLEAFMKEFDRFASIIHDISYITDIDSVPEKYINYLAQVVGYQEDIDEGLFNYITFREFIKNIIEIYKVKGTNFSIELFLGFIGFNVEVKEYWFDKRFYFLNENSERNITNKNLFEFYLTSTDPRNQVIQEINVVNNNMTKTKDVHSFEKRLSLGENLEDLLGFTPGYRKETYTFFKTNIISLNIVPYTHNIAIDSLKQNLIQSYIKFLIPIFIQNYTNFDILEDVDIPKTKTLYVYDTDRIQYDEWETGVSYLEGNLIQRNLEVFKCLKNHISNSIRVPGQEDEVYWVFYGRTNDINSGEYPEYMLHTYSGYYPGRYEWNDGIINYGDFRKGQGGIYPSGFYIDTNEKMKQYDFNDSYIENLTNLELLQRDILKPFEEHPGGVAPSYIFDQNILWSFIYLEKNFSYIKGDQLRNSYSFGEFQNQAEIQSINGNVLVVKEINPYGTSFFEEDKKIEVYSSTLSNRGIYTISSVSISGGDISITVLEGFQENQLAIGGFILPFKEDWKYENSINSFMDVENITIYNETEDSFIEEEYRNA